LIGLTFTHAIGLRRNIVKGRLHSGRGSVVQIVGAKG
jgi:hypothetical protein